MSVWAMYWMYGVATGLVGVLCLVLGTVFGYCLRAAEKDEEPAQF